MQTETFLECSDLDRCFDHRTCSGLGNCLGHYFGLECCLYSNLVLGNFSALGCYCDFDNCYH
ncbi:TBC1 domain family member 5 A-like X2 [Biomphalaria pfeifferi]|uniref:TBC1 domain family member 5 A-like X2 n=1 Tax=Biomphalaria pfeifferi TaxID=112525 RepID=A0AAD8F3X4_BIOPF|nr:TBC1 domain family member 5 A-like X2 [Biomphalaria pfeifferi]